MGPSTSGEHTSAHKRLRDTIKDLKQEDHDKRESFQRTVDDLELQISVVKDTLNEANQTTQVTLTKMETDLEHVKAELARVSSRLAKLESSSGKHRVAGGGK